MPAHPPAIWHRLTNVRGNWTIVPVGVWNATEEKVRIINDLGRKHSLCWQFRHSDRCDYFPTRSVAIRAMHHRAKAEMLQHYNRIRALTDLLEANPLTRESE